jgi:hypothetical protein
LAQQPVALDPGENTFEFLGDRGDARKRRCEMS